MKIFKCLNCGQPCEVITVESGGYEEVWGARVFHPQPTDVSDCCQEDYEEFDDE